MNDQDIIRLIDESLQKGLSIDDIAHTVLHKAVNVTKRYIKENNLVRSEEGKILLEERRKQKFIEYCENKWGKGIINPAQAPEVKAKIKQTFIDHYGCNPSSCDFFREKVRKTCLEKYGADNIAKSQKYQEICATGIPRKKWIETRNKLNNWNFNKSEEEIFQTLSTKFSNIKRQYRSEKYPFACDFYIVDTDTYIEYNGIWTHGPEEYDSTKIEHQQLIEKWKQKDSHYYDRAIQKWTILDPKKRQIAKKNNLNFKEFWNLKEFYSWFNSL